MGSQCPSIPASSRKLSQLAQGAGQGLGAAQRAAGGCLGGFQVPGLRAWSLAEAQVSSRPLLPSVLGSDGPWP